MTKLILRNDRGISVLFLIIAMLLMVTVTYVLSYLIPTKHKSVRFPIYSQQAFYIAQSGMEFAIRYASDQGWRGTTDGGVYDLNRLDASSRSLGNGAFNINYNNALGDILTSTGQISGSSENRVVRGSNFSQFLRLVFDPASPVTCWTLGSRRAHFFLKNVRNTDIILTAFSASWTQSGPQREIWSIYIAGSEKYNDSYSSGSGMVNFNRGGNSQTLTAGSVYEVEIRWGQNIASGANFVITLYTAAGESYAFNLDTAGDGLPAC
ncbi:MAG: hypothetical protein ABH969_06375 [Pseudomonadota bacterium]